MGTWTTRSTRHLTALRAAARASDDQPVTRRKERDEMDELTRNFSRDMTGIYERATRELGYSASYFLRMLSEDGALETARRLVQSSTPSDGFTALWEFGRLDLTVEALVLESQYAELFEDELLDTAAERLRAYGFEV
jgi:hypothetical protein